MTDTQLPGLDPHPELCAGLVEAGYAPGALLEPSPDWLLALLCDGASSPLSRDADLRGQVRDLLRHGGYKPTGRGKPSSEYLRKRAGEAGGLASINLAVDLGNAVSLHSGLPLSVVDRYRLHGQVRIRTAERGMRYVFNPSGQQLDVGGLLCLFDEEGPCANAVKDAQRTKTDAGTRGTLLIVWCPQARRAQAEAAVGWYQELLTRAGGETRHATVNDAPDP